MTKVLNVIKSELKILEEMQSLKLTGTCKIYSRKCYYFVCVFNIFVWLPVHQFFDAHQCGGVNQENKYSDIIFILSYQF